MAKTKRSKMKDSNDYLHANFFVPRKEYQRFKKTCKKNEVTMSNAFRGMLKAFNKTSQALRTSQESDDSNTPAV